MSKNFSFLAGNTAPFTTVLHCDGASFRVGLGTNVPAQSLHVVGSQFVTGNVGIGVTNPTSPLHVGGNTQITGNLTIGGDLTVSGTNTVVNTQTVTINDNVIVLNNNQTGTPLSTLVSGIEVERGDATNYRFVFEESTDTFKVGMVGSEQAVATRLDALDNNSIAVWNNATTQYTFRSDFVNLGGNVGIGTVNPVAKLHLVGNEVVTGNLGIGSSTPTQPLDVAGNVRTTGQVISTVATGTAPMTVASNTLVSNLNAQLLNGQADTFYRNASNLNVGTLPVGTGGTGTNTLTASKLLVGNGTNTVLTPTTLHWDNNNVRLGINTSSPSDRLDVNGGIMLGLTTDALGRVAIANGRVDGVDVSVLRNYVKTSSSDTSRALSNWVGRVSINNDGNQWKGVCWAPELGLFVSVGNSGSNRVMTSPDGIVWTARSSANESMSWKAVCWSPQLSLLVAVANGGTGNRVMTTPDGITWTSRASAQDTYSWTNVCWSPDRSLFVAVATDGTNGLMTSSDGITWTLYGSTNAPVLWDVTWASELGLFVAVGANSFTSPDGITWTSRVSGARFCVTWSPELSLLVAVGGTNASYSSDGISWSSVSIPSTNNNFFSVTWSPQMSAFVAVGWGGVANVRLAYSTNGVSWVAMNTINDNYNWDSVCWSPELNIFLAVAWGSGSTNRVMTSLPVLPASRSAIVTNPRYITVNNSTGNVGIGSTSPTQTLDVAGIVKTSGQIQIGQASGTAPITITSSTLVTNLNVQFLNGQADTFYRSAANLIGTFNVASGGTGSTVLASNKVLVGNGTNSVAQPTNLHFDTTTNRLGIGSVSPIEVLDVVGNVRATGTMISTVTTGTAPLTVSSTTVVPNLNASFLNGQADTFYRNAENLNAGTVLVGRGGTGASTLASSKLLVGNGTNSVAAPTNLHFDTVNNRLGIGSTAPAQPLDVAGNVRTTGQVISTVAAGTAPLTVTSSTLVNNLNVQFLNGQADTFYRNISNFTAGTLSVSTGGTGSTTLTSSKLLVGNGTGAVLTPTNLHWDTANSRVGIGSTVPTRTLDVAGDIVVGSTTDALGRVVISNGRVDGIDVSALSKRVNASSAESTRGVTNWISRTTPNSLTWSEVCWSSNLGLYVAVSNSNITSNKVLVSSNGIDWVSYASADDTAQWASVCWSPELSLFVAVANVGTGNRVMTSINGTSWTIRASSNDTIGWKSVCWSAESSLFVAVADSGTGNRVMTSVDGVTWTSRAAADDTIAWTDVIWVSDLSLFVAGGNAGIMTSPTGITWTMRSFVVAFGVAWSPELSLLVAAGWSSVTLSSNGITWTNIASPPAAIFGSISWAPELSIFVAVANQMSINNNVWTSIDGNTWIRRTTPISTIINSVCWSREMGMFTLVGTHIHTSIPVLPSSNSALITNPKHMIVNNTTGNVGIGSASPFQLLDIAGNVRTTGQVISAASSGTAPLTLLSSTLVSNLNSQFLNGQADTFYRNAANLNAGTTSVAVGGTGANTLASNKVLVGNGTSAVAAPTALHWDATNTRLGINTATPGFTLHVQGDLNYTGSLYQGGSLFTGSQWTSGTGLIHYGVGSGNVGIGSATPQYKLHVVGDVYATQDVMAFSDARVKTDLRVIDNALEKVEKINGYTFARNDLDDTSKRFAGVIAQEIREVLPEVIHETSDGYLSVAYGNIVALLIEGMKEQQKEIKDLKLLMSQCKS